MDSSDNSDDFKSAMHGGYYIPIISSGIVTTITAISAYFFYKYKTNNSKISNVEDCIRQKVNLYLVLGIQTADGVNTPANKIKLFIKTNKKQLYEQCHPLWDVAHEILTDVNKKKSYDKYLNKKLEKLEPISIDMFLKHCALPTMHKKQQGGKTVSTYNKDSFYHKYQKYKQKYISLKSL